MDISRMLQMQRCDDKHRVSTRDYRRGADPVGEALLPRTPMKAMGTKRAQYI